MHATTAFEKSLCSHFVEMKKKMTKLMNKQDQIITTQDVLKQEIRAIKYMRVYASSTPSRRKRPRVQPSSAQGTPNSPATPRSPPQTPATPLSQRISLTRGLTRISSRRIRPSETHEEFAKLNEELEAVHDNRPFYDFIQELLAARVKRITSEMSVIKELVTRGTAIHCCR
jgi:hypothetical protein